MGSLIDRLGGIVARTLLGSSAGDSERQRIASLLASGTGGSMAANLLALLLGLGVHLLLARLMGVDSYGVYVLAVTWVNVVYVLLCLGYDVTAVRFVPAYLGQQDFGRLNGFLRTARRIILLNSILFLVFALLSLILARPLLGREMYLCLLAGAVLVPLKALVQFVSSVLRGLKQAARSILLSRVLGQVLLGGGVVLIWFLPGVAVSAPLAMAVNVAGTVLLLLLIVRYLSGDPVFRSGGAEPVSERSEWRRVAMPLLVINLFQLILVRTDILMIGALMDSTEAGIYNIAGQLAMLILFTLNSANQILAPQIAELHAQKRTAALQSLMTVAARGIFALTIPVALVLLILGKWILGWFGEEFTAGYTVMLILAAG
ncbi:oligosaccharide flippase family protein, partial [Gemmatimonadota bacterium]